MSAGSGFAGNSCLSVLFLSNFGFWLMKDAAGSEFHVFLGGGNAGILQVLWIFE